jgi:hypothetical protein
MPPSLLEHSPRRHLTQGGVHEFEEPLARDRIAPAEQEAGDFVVFSFGYA